MPAPSLKPTGNAAVQVELLARLGLPPSASPEDVDQLHEAASRFLAAAPPELRRWARAQVASLDAAYLQLTDPAGLEGSALMGPASPPTVVPGGPATPPARRDPVPAAAPPPSRPAPVAAGIDLGDGEPASDEEPSVEELAALYAMVTPSAHEDMLPGTRPAAGATAKPARRAPAPAHAPVAASVAASGQSNLWKTLFLGLVFVLAAVFVGVGANAIVNSGLPGAPAASPPVAQATSGAPAIDQAKVGQLMEQYQADPGNQDTLMALADEFYAGGLFTEAGSWLDRLLALNPDHVQGLLARGAVYFNLRDLPNAEKAWLRVAAIEPDNVEVHYDLGFLYLNRPEPNWAGVQAEWSRVVELDPGSTLAQTVQAHLDSLVGASMLPGASPSAEPAASAEPAPSADASPSAEPAASPEASAVP